MITRNYNSTSHKNKEDQTLGPEKLSAQVKSSLFSLLWEESITRSNINERLMTAKQAGKYATR